MWRLHQLTTNQENNRWFGYIQHKPTNAPLRNDSMHVERKKKSIITWYEIVQEDLISQSLSKSMA